ncbi:MAG: CHAD domain-containing protein [Anaerolineae bacterium]|nr:CHAD domain-containing protein [Anaerolineae bacterium]
MKNEISPVLYFGSKVLLRHLNALEGELDGVRSGGADIEHIHRTRVATRRLRAALPLFAAELPKKAVKAWTGKIRSITRALGAARDADVQIDTLTGFMKEDVEERDRNGLARLELRLRQHRATLQPPVVEAIDHFLASGTLEGMREVLEPLADLETGAPFDHNLYEHAQASILPCLVHFLSYDAIVRDVERVTELHEMRIAAKRLRYTMETFAPIYANDLKPWLPAVRDFQEVLGDIHDCDVWVGFLPEFMVQEKQRVEEFYGTARPFVRLAPGIQSYLDNRRARRAKLYERFLNRWQASLDEALWQRLEQVIVRPALDERRLFPPLDKGE